MHFIFIKMCNIMKYVSQDIHGATSLDQPGNGSVQNQFFWVGFLFGSILIGWEWAGKCNGLVQFGAVAVMDWSGLGPVPCLPPDLVPMQLTTRCCLLICLESVCYCLSQRSVLPLSPAEIPRRELEAVLRRLGHGEPSDDQLDAVAAMAAQPPAPGGEDDLMEAFRVFDADGDGFVGFQDFARMMMNATTAPTTTFLL